MKTLLDFDNKLIAVGQIQIVTKKTIWSEKWEQDVFLIMINDKALYESNSGLPEIKIEYLNEEYRDKKYKELYKKLSSFEHIEILV